MLKGKNMSNPEIETIRQEAEKAIAQYLSLTKRIKELGFTSVVQPDNTVYVFKEHRTVEEYGTKYVQPVVDNRAIGLAGNN